MKLINVNIFSFSKYPFYVLIGGNIKDWLALKVKFNLNFSPESEIVCVINRFPDLNSIIVFTFSLISRMELNTHSINTVAGTVLESH